MKPSAIEVGKTYVNKGKGFTRRKVLEMGTHLKADWWSTGPAPQESVVRFYDFRREREDRLYLRSFASWAGREVEE